jgi:phosphoglycolate phosphatase-like HAD superfamily hydrolase
LFNGQGMPGPVAARRILLQFTGAASICSAARAFAPIGGTSTIIRRRPMSSSAPPASPAIRPTALAATTATATATGIRNEGGEGLYLFDFDGVVCDSCDECTVSALRTVRRLGALDQPMDTVPDHPPRWLFDNMRAIRPAIEVGWQIPVLLSVFLDQRHAQEHTADGPAAMPVDDIVANYEELVDGWLAKYGKTEADMIDAFGTVRDDWIATDLDSWLDINAFYPGVAESINNCKGEGVLVTTKQQRFAIALCRHAGVNEAALADEDIYGLGMYKKKADVIVDRMEAGGYSSDATHFFEDRWPTLAKCLADDRLEGVRLYLCSWGYVTDAERALAAAEPRVEVIGLDDFASIVGATCTANKNK